MSLPWRPHATLLRPAVRHHTRGQIRRHMVLLVLGLRSARGLMMDTDSVATVAREQELRCDVSAIGGSTMDAWATTCRPPQLMDHGQTQDAGMEWPIMLQQEVFLSGLTLSNDSLNRMLLRRFLSWGFLASLLAFPAAPAAPAAHHRSQRSLHNSSVMQRAGRCYHLLEIVCSIPWRRVEFRPETPRLNHRSMQQAILVCRRPCWPMRRVRQLLHRAAAAAVRHPVRMQAVVLDGASAMQCR